MPNTASQLEVEVGRDAVQPIRLRERLWRLLANRRAPLVLAAVAALLSMRSLTMGLQGDDHTLRYDTVHGRSPFSMFHLEGQEVADGMQVGRFPWWTNPDFSMRFFRPGWLITHWVDFNLWPEAAWAMYLQNIVLYALIVAVAVLVYRRVMPNSAYAGLAGLMFAMSPGHAQVVGWISSRNALQTTLFSLLALLAYMQARTAGNRRYDILSVACTALALLCGEAGLTALMFVFAYALVLESGPLVQRLRQLAPHVVVCGVWASSYLYFRWGIRGLSLYRDLSEPISLLTQGLLDLPIWLVALVGPSVAGLSMLLETDAARLLSLLFVAPLLWCLWPAIRATRHGRFFAVAAVLCIPPLFTTLPQDRLLMAASFGAFGCIAGFLEASARRAQLFARTVRGTLYAVHLWLAPALFLLMLGASAVLLEKGSQSLVAALPESRKQAVVLVNSPNELLSTYATMILRNDGAEPPRALHQLYAGASELRIRRIDERTLEVEPARGWGSIPTERLSSGASFMPRAGDTRSVHDMRVEVSAENSQHLPARARFEFPTRLEDDARVWLIWQGTRPVAWRPPAVGEQIVVPGLNVMTALGG